MTPAPNYVHGPATMNPFQTPQSDRRDDILIITPENGVLSSQGALIDTAPAVNRWGCELLVGYDPRTQLFAWPRNHEHLSDTII